MIAKVRKSPFTATQCRKPRFPDFLVLPIDIATLTNQLTASESKVAYHMHSMTAWLQLKAKKSVVPLHSCHNTPARVCMKQVFPEPVLPIRRITFFPAVAFLAISNPHWVKHPVPSGQPLQKTALNMFESLIECRLDITQSSESFSKKSPSPEIDT